MSELNQPRPAFITPDKEMLNAFLDYHRAVLLHKLEGLSEENLRRRSLPSTTMTLLSIVKHLAYTERDWFQIIFAGQGQETEPPWSEEDPDADWRIEPDETTEQILAFYQSQVEKSRQITAANNLDDLTSTSFSYSPKQRSLRWVLLHMIEETARHNGHADLLRESIDGVTGD